MYNIEVPEIIPAIKTLCHLQVFQIYTINFFLSFIFYYFHTTCKDQYKHKLLYIALVRKAFTCLNNHS